MGFPLRDVNEVLERLPMPLPGRASLVCVEGLGGAGKSTLAIAMAEARADICVVHGDDFYGPEERDWRSWSPREGCQRYFDHRRLERDLPTSTLGEWVDIRPQGIIVVEGVYLLRRWLRPYWDFSIYVDTPRELRQHRLYARGENDEGWIARWTAAEDYYETAEQPEQTADAIIKGY
jgi:uridine kinase